jgi:hypothetical protein
MSKQFLTFIHLSNSVYNSEAEAESEPFKTMSGKPDVSSLFQSSQGRVYANLKFFPGNRQEFFDCSFTSTDNMPSGCFATALGAGEAIRHWTRPRSGRPVKVA